MIKETSQTLTVDLCVLGVGGSCVTILCCYVDVQPCMHTEASIVQCISDDDGIRVISDHDSL